MSEPTKSLSIEQSLERKWWRRTLAKEIVFVATFATISYLLVTSGSNAADHVEDPDPQQLPLSVESGDGIGNPIDIADAVVQCLGEGAVHGGVQLGSATVQLPDQPARCRV